MPTLVALRFMAANHLVLFLLPLKERREDEEWSHLSVACSLSVFGLQPKRAKADSYWPRNLVVRSRFDELFDGYVRIVVRDQFSVLPDLNGITVEHSNRNLLSAKFHGAVRR